MCILLRTPPGGVIYYLGIHTLFVTEVGFCGILSGRCTMYHSFL